MLSEPDQVGISTQRSLRGSSVLGFLAGFSVSGVEFEESGERRLPRDFCRGEEGMRT